MKVFNFCFGQSARLANEINTFYEENKHSDISLQKIVVRTCEICGHTGEDVHEYPTYKCGHDITSYQCDDIAACLSKKEAKR